MTILYFLVAFIVVTLAVIFAHYIEDRFLLRTKYTIIPGEKGINGGGDAGDGIFSERVLYIAPGKAGMARKDLLK